MTELMADGKVLFSKAELACKATGGVKLATGFAEHLIELRLAYNRPMKVTSCCRSAEHNARVGGHSRSLHVFDKPEHPIDGTAAIDIIVDRPVQFIQLALDRGWSVGVARNFLHVDRRDFVGLPQHVFGYN